ncbi:MAG: ABC transporter ATP-binding protein [Acholeplasmatales bacterium]|nr:ABC transporter ATP-binding protein [Acholeplasmatales bacterium]
MNVIEVKNLSKSYGDLKAVDNISFEVYEGELFAFLGVNGAGKSTTINMICNIIKPDSGEIKICGESILNSEAKRQIGVVFQGSVLDDRLTVLENLKSRAACYELDKNYIKERIDYLTNILDLSEILNKKYKSLSGGQRRRADIARALIHNPKILFLDEPTTGLDPKSRIMVWKVIDDLRKNNNLTVFLTTHYMEETKDANRVVIIDHGHILVSDSPINLKEKYTKNYLKIYIDKNIDIENRFNGFEYKTNAYYIPFDKSEDVIEFIENNKDILSDFEVIKGDMDDVFLKVTGKELE